MKQVIGRFFSILRSMGVFLLIWGTVMPFLLLIFFAFRKQAMMGFTGYTCLMDYVHMLNEGFISKLMFLPFSVAVIATISEQRHTANYLVRQKSRRFIIVIQQIKALLLSLVFATYFIVLAVLIAGLFTGTVINWSSMHSYYYGTHGYVLDILVAEIILSNFYQAFMSMYILSALMVMLSIFIRKVYAFLIIMAFSAADIFGLLSYELGNLMNFQSNTPVYMQFPAELLYFAILPTIAVLFVILSMKLVNRKEYLCI